MLQTLKFDNKTRRQVVTLVEHHDVQIPCRDRSICKWMGRLGLEVGRVLTRLLEGGLNGEVQNRREELFGIVLRPFSSGFTGD